jgi:phosphoenolpyruvate carboxylase
MFSGFIYYIDIYIQNKTKKSNLIITQNTQLQSQNQGKKKKKKYQPPQNYKQRFKTHKSNKKIKIRTIVQVITHTIKSTNQIKEQKRKKKLHLSYTNYHRSIGGKKKFERSTTNYWGNR